MVPLFEWSAEAIGPVRKAVTTIIVSLAWTACSVAGPNQSASADSGKTFSLKTGESAQLRDESSRVELRVGFDSVTTDSRCPEGVQCVWAGTAAVRVWLQQGSGPREIRELQLWSATVPAASTPGHDLRLVRLDPYPGVGRAIAKSDYIATLTLGRYRSTDPER